jgi:signal transduction histidine kinase
MNGLHIKIRVLAVASVIFAAFNAVIFIVPFTRGGNFWTAYLFTVLAFALSAAVSFRTIGQASRVIFYRWPVMYVTWVYLASQFSSGMIFASVPAIPVWVGASSGVIMLALCLVICVTAGGANAEIERLDDAVRVKVSFLRSLRDEIECLVARTEDAKLKAMLAELAEELRYSDPVSGLHLAGLEDEIKAKADSLGSVVSGGFSQDAADACEELRRLLAERNRKCLSTKNTK